MDKSHFKTAKEVTPEVIAAWKAKYPNGIAEISTGKFKGWLRKPTRNEMREFMSLQTDPVTYTERILETIWLGGDDELKTNDEAFYSIMPEVQNVLEIKEAQLKKL
jgi:hypothetical protein